MSRVEISAPAKINLTLEVMGKRSDGFHDIVSVMVAVDLADELVLEEAAEVSLACDDPALSGPDNLALRAAITLREAAGVAAGVRISLKKNIPVAAGLGGGSSDAAAVLIGLNRLWGLGMSAEELTPIAAGLGSDVPFFLYGGTAMVGGRGDIVRPLPPADIKHAVILTPSIEVAGKTGVMFAALQPEHHTRGALTRKLEARIRGGGDVPAQFLFNAFDDVAIPVFAGLQECWDAFAGLGATEIHLCGAGPSLFTLAARREVATTLALLARHRYGWSAHAVEPTPPVDWPGDSGGAN